MSSHAAMTTTFSAPAVPTGAAPAESDRQTRAQLAKAEHLRLAGRTDAERFLHDNPALIARWAHDSETADGRRELLSTPGINEWPSLLCNVATTMDRLSTGRGSILTLLSNLMSSTPFVDAVGAHANPLIVGALGLDQGGDYDFKFYTQAATLYALRMISQMTIAARYELLLGVTGTKWARVLVGLSSALLFALGTAAVKALGTAAVKALATITIAVDPNDPALINLRAKAVKDMLDANLPSVMHALIENSHQKSAANDPVPAEWEAPQALVGLYLLAGSTPFQARFVATVEVELKKEPCLFTNLVALLEVSSNRSTKVEVMNCLTLVLETYRQVASDEHKNERSLGIHWECLQSKLPSLLIRELGVDGDDPSANFEGMIASFHSAVVCLYYLHCVWKDNNEVVRVLGVVGEAGGIKALVHGLQRTLRAVEDENARTSGAPLFWLRHVKLWECIFRNGRWHIKSRTELLNLVRHAVLFLRNAASVSSNRTEMLEADILQTLWHTEEVFRRSHLRDEFKKAVDELFAQMAPDTPPPTGVGLFHLLGGHRWDGLTLELALFMQCASAGGAPQVDVMRAILRRGNIDINARNVEGVVYKMGSVHAQGYTAWGFTALMYAAANGHLDVVRLLLEWGADVMVRAHEKPLDVNDVQATNDGKTALYWAQLNGRYDVARLLLERHGHGGRNAAAAAADDDDGGGGGM